MFVFDSDALWDRLLFGWVKKMVGGRCRLLVVGSAPLAGNILTFMRASLGCIVSVVVVVVVVIVAVVVVVGGVVVFVVAVVVGVVVVLNFVIFLY